MGGKKPKVSLRDIPMTRAQVIMRDDIQRPKTITQQRPEDRICQECGGRLRCVEYAPSTYRWTHGEPGAMSHPSDQHLSASFAVIMVWPEWGQEARTIGQVLDETIAYGITTKQVSKLDRDQAVTDIALEVISEGPRLQLDLNQWAVVQALVEAAVRAGSDAEQQGRI